jgi:ABC-type antimicrobial peptide transport system ATPase subunit
MLHAAVQGGVRGIDEATSALDPHTERQIVTTLNRVGVGRTTVAITHRLTSIVDYDEIFVLVDGELVEQGTDAQLRVAGGAYARLWAEQTGDPALAMPPLDRRDPLTPDAIPAGRGRLAAVHTPTDMTGRGHHGARLDQLP